MKNIFRSLGVLTLLLALVGQSFPQTCRYVDGQVRYAFELKQLTAQEAQQAKTQGYVDLWTYACFDQAFVDAGYITLNSEGKITRWALLSSDASHGYVIVDKNGAYDQTGNIALFAVPSADAGCSGRSIYQQAEEGYVPRTFFNVCPLWGYGSSSSRASGVISNPILADLYCTTLEAEGKTWYCLKMYQVRFEYKQAQSFYVTFTKEDRGTDQAYAGTNFNFMAESSLNQLLWPGAPCGAGQDWTSTSYWGAIRGGVEVIADPEFTLAASATCGGSDLQGSFKVNNWNGKSWSDYKAVKMYVNTDGGTRKDITAQTTVTPSLPLNSASTAADFNYTLAPAAYMMNGAPADSLIWAFEEEKIALI